MEQEIKVGDRVVGVGVVGGKNIDGKTGTIKGVGEFNVAIEFDDDINGWGSDYYGIKDGRGWGCHIKNLRRITEDAPAPSPSWSIHITPKGNVTHAVFKQGKHVHAHTFALCSPSDTYDATAGAAWAFLRLPGMADATRRVLAEMDGAKGQTQDKLKKGGLTLEECKVGMRVRFRRWEDMEKECEKNFLGTLKRAPGFSEDMRYLCGKCATVRAVSRNKAFGYDEVTLSDASTAQPYDEWHFATWMLEPADVAADPAPAPQPMYKPGDRVRIVSERKGGTYIPIRSVDMASWMGKEMTIRSKEGAGYSMKEDDGLYTWSVYDIAGKVGESRKEK